MHTQAWHSQSLSPRAARPLTPPVLGLPTPRSFSGHRGYGRCSCASSWSRPNCSLLPNTCNADRPTTEGRGDATRTDDAVGGPRQRPPKAHVAQGCRPSQLVRWFFRGGGAWRVSPLGPRVSPVRDQPSYIIHRPLFIINSIISIHHHRPHHHKPLSIIIHHCSRHHHTSPSSVGHNP